MQRDTLAVRNDLVDMRYNQQPTVITREVEALTHPDPIRSSMAGYQGPPRMTVQPKPSAWNLKPYEGPPQKAVSQVPSHIQPPSSNTPAAQCVEVVDEMRAVDFLRDNFSAHRPTVRDTMQARLHQHYNGTDYTIGANLNIGLISRPLVVRHRDMTVVETQPLAVPTDMERAATAAGSQAWYDVADAQARANFAAIERASEDAFREAQACFATFDDCAHART